jgi:hypothetical protein
MLEELHVPARNAGIMEGAAFSNPSSGKIDQQRQILEDLKRQQKLLKSGTGPNLLIIPSAQTQPPLLESHIPSGQRSALESANKSSFGYFIPQDSSFGNIILPVIPRLQKKPAA